MTPVVFSYSLARSAIRAMDDLAEVLRALVRTHDDALAVAHEDFESQTRTQFDADVASEVDQLTVFARLLDAEADEVRHTIATAQWLESLAADRP